MAFFDSLSVEQIAELLEDASDVVKATVFIEPPENALLSDGDSDDDEPTGDINKLSGNQLRAGAELVCEKETEDGLEIKRYGAYEEDTDEDEVPGTPESSPNRMRTSFLNWRRKVNTKSSSENNEIGCILQNKYGNEGINQQNNDVDEGLEDQDGEGVDQRIRKVDNTSENQSLGEEKNVNEMNYKGTVGLETNEVMKNMAANISDGQEIVNTRKEITHRSKDKDNMIVASKLKRKRNFNSKKIKKVNDPKKLKADSQTNLPKKKKERKIRNWEIRDIPDTSSVEFERPRYLDKDFTPLEAFELFFDDDVVKFIVECSNEFAIEKGNMNFVTTKEEIRLYFAILLLSGYNLVPRTRMYWETSEDVHNKAISKAMSRNRFEEIMRCIHFCKNAEIEKEDRFGKIRPVWNMLNERWLTFFPGDAYLSVDESMVPYYGRYGAKQHIHGKPIQFGYKVWVLATRLGYMIQGEPYQGKSTGMIIPGLGVGGSVVIDLLSELPQNKKYCVFFDNYFTSFRLLEALKAKGHDGTGTVRADRIENAPLPEPKFVKKEQRGSYHQLTDQETNITLVRYKDNNVFTMASTVAGVQPVGKAKRWSNEQKKHILIDQPASVVLYNTYMGGVDRLDENIATYRINIRSKKWYWPMISYMLSVSMNNAWLIYRLTSKGREEKLDFLGFMRYVVKCYMAKYIGNRPTAGRPSAKASSRIPSDVRYSGNHFLETSTTQIRCAHCGKATRKICTTCRIGCHVLCDKPFHTK